MLETERLILRKWTEEDAESLFEYAKDPEIGPAAGWPPHKSVEESRAVIKNVFDGAECYAICEKEKNIAIGAVELKLNGTRIKQSVTMSANLDIGLDSHSGEEAICRKLPESY